jgi:hypothetical protein
MTKHIAIFNSFSFHYEMFGYIIYYCYLNKYKLSIYTEENYNMGWFVFYNHLFVGGNKYELNFIHYTKFEEESQQNNYDLVFLITDDDPLFDVRWMNSRVVCINHYYVCRRIDWFHCIGTRPFSENLINWAVPCIPIFSYSNKFLSNDNDFMHVAIVGGGNLNDKSYDISIINRLNCNKKIIIHVISRLIKCDFNELSHNIEIKKYQSVPTDQMYSILLKCNYLLTDVDNVMNVHRNGHSMSGSIPIAFSSLSRLIISKENNLHYKFGSVKEFDLNSNDSIFLEETNEETFKLIEQERNHLIGMFHTHVDNIININSSYNYSSKKIVNKNTALIVEPRFLEIIPYVIYEYYKVLGKDWVIVFYCGKGLKQFWENKLDLVKNIEIRELEVNNLDVLQYSYFFKQQQLWETLYGEFVLTFQIDSIIKNIEPYTIENYIKLDKSYIGGNMCYDWKELARENIFPTCKNFNGGLSLRKRVDMIKIIKMFGVEFTENNSLNIKTDPEDVYFTIGCYKLNLPIGDDDYCSHFAVHSIYYDTFFGVHNSIHLPKRRLIKDHSDLEFFVNKFI